MANLFPDSERRVFQQNPLAEVICQLRFQPVLRIETEMPADFQDGIRARFPGYTKQATGLPAGLPQEVARALFAQGLIDGAERRTLHRFDGRRSHVSLARDSVALSTEAYSDWEAFFDDLTLVVKALAATYRPSDFTRVGLRYRNLIHRTAIGLGVETPWTDLLAPHALGELVEPRLAAAAVETLRQLSLQFGRANRVTIRHGLVREEETQEQCYIVDADFYTEATTSWDDARVLLTEYREQAGYLFRWLITEKLFKVLGPLTEEA